MKTILELGEAVPDLAPKRIETNRPAEPLAHADYSVGQTRLLCNLEQSVRYQGQTELQGTQHLQALFQLT